MTPIETGIPFFSVRELACKGAGVVKLDPRFADALVELRRMWNKPLSPSSVCRTPEHNSSVGGHPRSLHLTENPHHPTHGTMAVEIGWRGWRSDDQLAFARLAWSMGWAVGLHDGFCHIDRRRDIGLTQAVFLYGQWNGVFAPRQVMV